MKNEKAIISWLKFANWSIDNGSIWCKIEIVKLN